LKALRIGTRGSPLARWQAHAVGAAITRAGGPPAEIVTIKTTGDRLAQAVLAEVGGKAVFVKEIEEALRRGTVDVAVHSAKDLPGSLPAGLCIRAVLPREDPRDAVTLPAARMGKEIEDPSSLIHSVEAQPRIGTGSVRRVAQLSRKFPDARFEQIRGNVGTRLRKLDEGQYDLLVLAAAGLVRLGLAHRISGRLSFDQCMPAPGQGIVAIEAREDDRATTEVLAAVNDPLAMAALKAERALLVALGGDCHVPIGGVATSEGTNLTLRAIVASVDGSRVLREYQRGKTSEPTRLGRQVADVLIREGAADIIAEHRS